MNLGVLILIWEQKTFRKNNLLKGTEACLQLLLLKSVKLLAQVLLIKNLRAEHNSTLQCSWSMNLEFYLSLIFTFQILQQKIPEGQRTWNLDQQIRFISTLWTSRTQPSQHACLPQTHCDTEMGAHQKHN